MNLSETAFFLKEVKVLWKSVDTSSTAVSVWHRQIGDLTLEQAQRALDAYARGVTGEDYPPKPADLLRLVTRAALHLPNEDEAWRMVKAEVNRVGTGRSYFQDGNRYVLRPSLPVPEVAIAADTVGWRHIAHTLGVPEQEGYTQDAFRKAYNRACQQTRERALLFGTEGIDDWRREQARDVQSLRLGDPQTLYDLGAPEAYAALIDGSGPRAKQLVADLTPTEPEVPAIPAEVQRERQQVVNARIRLLGQALRGQALPSGKAPVDEA